MEYVKAKTILSSKIKGNYDWFGIDYNMNLYRGCSHGCIYCDSRSNCYHIDNFDKVKVKENANLILENELIRKKEKGVIGIGSMSDTYNPFEKQLQLTRNSLKLILKYGYGVSIDTKSNLILRDLDLLKEINKNNNVIVKITITTPREELSKIIEPNVCTSSKRFNVVKELSDQGIFVGILMMPILPFITDSESDIRKMVRLSYESGAKFIYTYLGVTLRENQRDYYYQKLDNSFRGLKDRYIKTYGNNYQCNIPDYNRLYKVFTEECEKYGILYRMKDIINTYKKERSAQITLFD